jgi:hypothetical protein
MRKVDRDAMQRALVEARQESPGPANQLAWLEREFGWERAGDQASYNCQCRNLALRPWQSPPMSANITDEDDSMGPAGGRKAAAVLLKRLLDAGLSRYEPDPIGALERVAAAKAAATAG